MSELTSAEQAGGVAAGFTGHIHGFNADGEARLDAMMMAVGKWVESEAGMLLGHIKMNVTVDGKGITLNLTDLEKGVEHHDRLRPAVKADFNFMAAVLDVDKDELEHRMLHAMEDSGVDFCIDEHECSCGCHDHEHEHHHHHHDGEECHCHEHDHEHHHHHHDGEECHCHEHRHKE